MRDVRVQTDLIAASKAFVHRALAEDKARCFHDGFVHPLQLSEFAQHWAAIVQHPTTGSKLLWDNGSARGRWLSWSPTFAQTGLHDARAFVAGLEPRVATAP